MLHAGHEQARQAILLAERGADAAHSALFPKVRGRARSDDGKVLSGIIYVKRHGLRWQDAPAVYGPYKALYNRFARWSRMGVFARIFQEPAQPGA